MTETADTVLRLMTIGQFVLVAAALGIRRPRQPLTWLLAILMACTMAYLLLSGGQLAPPRGPFRMLLLGLAPTIPFAVWAVVMTAFDDDFRHGQACIVGLLLIAGTLAVAFTALPGNMAPMFATFLRLASLLVLAHAVFRTLSGRRDDLLEARRRWRLVAVMMMVLQVTSVLLVELVITAPEVLAVLTPVNAGFILALTTFFGMAFLTVDSVDGPAAPRPTEIGAGRSGTDARLGRALQALIEAGGLWQPGLTVAGLAAQVGVPEHRLRRHITRDLGHRNFNAFLNTHRVAEAKRRLSDPAFARTPVLTIAMDIGYGSLGPFNRAFRDITGTTPTVHRRENIADS